MACQGWTTKVWVAQGIAVAVGMAACSGGHHGKDGFDAAAGHGQDDSGAVVADGGGCEAPDAGAASCTLPGCPETFASLPAGFDLYGVWIAPTREVWAVGEGGFVGRRTEATGAWCWCAPSAGQTLRSVWGASTEDIFAVGDGGTLLRMDGTRWLSYYGGVSALRGVHGTGPADVWAVGDHGVALHFKGTGWDVDGVESKYDLNGVWVDPTGVARAAGHAPLPEGLPGASFTDEAVILHHSSDPAVTGWTVEASFPQRGIATFQGISGTSSTNIWAVGINTPSGAAAGFGFAARFDGTAWARVSDPTEIFNSRFPTDVAVGTPDASAAWLTAGPASGLRYDGTTFTTSDAIAGMNAIDADGTAIYAVGTDGKVVRWTAETGWAVDRSARPPFAIPVP